MAEAHVYPEDFVEFNVDTGYLDNHLVAVSPELTQFLSEGRDVAPCTLVNPPCGIAVECEFHRKLGVLSGRGLRRFLKTVMAISRVPRRLRLYIAKSRLEEGTFAVVTCDQLAKVIGIRPDQVDTFVRIAGLGRTFVPGRRTRRSHTATRSGSSGAKVTQARRKTRGATLMAADARSRACHAGDEGSRRAGASVIRAANAGGPDTAALREAARDIMRTQLLAVPDDVAIPVDKHSVDTILARLGAGQFDTVESAEVHEQALILSASPGFDTLVSLDVIRSVVPFAYQVGAVKDVLRKMRGRAILADEVGLGKTIEAGVVMMEYVLRGLARRVLILCPPPLMSQWMDEMRSKFNMDFVASDDPAFVERKNPWLEFDRIIASIDTAKREPHAKAVQATPFDLVIVDEAHRCRNRNTLNWKLVNGLKKKYILLLTATPVQNDLQELFNLITLLRPGQLETASDFSRRFITRGDRLKPRNVADLRALMKEVMVRNRRATCGLELPRRRAETVRISLAPQEREFYERVTEFIRTQYAAGGYKGPARLTLKTLQKEAGSTAFAAVPTIGKMLVTGQFPHGKRELKRILDLGESVAESAKAEALLRLLQATSDKVLVFTGYTATLHFLAQYLKRAGVSFATFSGEMGRLDKERSVKAFGDRDGVQVLLSTESGGEGRNLQFCHVMVNFDLPWNPMKIEQRVGRIHRIGQENEVLVFNLSAADTLEGHILDLLDAKINMFELVVGELDMILGNVEEEADFEDTIMDLWASSKTEDELKARLDGLGAQLADAKARYDRTKEYEDALFGSDLATAAVADGASTNNGGGSRGGGANGRG
ncbi:MAG: SNF2-related protein [Bacillota bacterium]|nr:SNF2-related protein [Bacillota bacterium]